jgi:hypothetical protein
MYTQFVYDAPFPKNNFKEDWRPEEIFEFIHGYIVGEILVELCWLHEYNQFLYMPFTNNCLFFSDLISKNFFLYFPLRGDNLNLELQQGHDNPSQKMKILHVLHSFCPNAYLGI